MLTTSNQSEQQRVRKFSATQKKIASWSRPWLIVLAVALLSGCVTPPPQNPENICLIFEERRDWWKGAKRARERYGVPVHVPMAMMYQESSFKARALPPRRYVLGFIPWGRVSTAYGYAQAKTMTWEDYVRETGNRRARRDNFDDAIDFMGWFITKSQQVNGVSKWDAYAQYLNYHEGWGGYQRRTYLQKPWLIRVSRIVDERSLRYAQQLRGCEKQLNRNWFQRLLFG